MTADRIKFISSYIFVFKALFFGLFLLFGLASNAQEVNVPLDELARESVYPIFDNKVAVKNRNVKDVETFDVGVFGGFAITEPVFDATKLGFAFNYHFSEVHSLGILWAKNTIGLSKDAIGLKDDFLLDFTRAPYPEYSLMSDYNYKLYYGKLSVTKTGVINTTLFTSASLGMIKFIHKSYMAMAIGVGERFYLTNNLALKVDFRVFFNNAPIPFKSSALRIGTDPVPAYDSFDERMTITSNLDLGLHYLF